MLLRACAEQAVVSQAILQHAQCKQICTLHLNTGYKLDLQSTGLSPDLTYTNYVPVML